MYKIIANPNKYDGELVRIHGYYVHEFEREAIFVTPYAAQNYVSIDGFWVDFSQDVETQMYTGNGVERPIDLIVFSHKHVVIEGVFSVDQKGHMSAYTGTIVNARRIMASRRSSRENQ